MDDKDKKIEHLETEVAGLKIRLARVEDFILSMPSSDDFPINVSQDDDLIKEAVEVVLEWGRVSASLLQRRLNIGYARAAVIVDILETKGLITPADGTSKPRGVVEDKIKAFLEIADTKEKSSKSKAG